VNKQIKQLDVPVGVGEHIRINKKGKEYKRCKALLLREAVLAWGSTGKISGEPSGGNCKLRVEKLKVSFKKKKKFQERGRFCIGIDTLRGSKAEIPDRER